MPSLGSGEILTVLLLALVVLGPEKLPEAARKIGSFIRQAKAMTAGWEQDVRKAIDLDAITDPMPRRSEVMRPAAPAPLAPLAPVPSVVEAAAPPDTEPIAEPAPPVPVSGRVPIDEDELHPSFS